MHMPLRSEMEEAIAVLLLFRNVKTFKEMRQKLWNFFDLGWDDQRETVELGTKLKFDQIFDDARRNLQKQGLIHAPERKPEAPFTLTFEGEGVLRAKMENRLEELSLEFDFHLKRLALGLC